MKRILYILALTFLAASCDWLAITPENSIDEDDLFTSGYGFRNALNGVYLKIGSRDLYGENLSWGFLSAAAQEYLTDDSQQGSYTMQATKDAADFIYNSTNTQPVIQTIWETQYSVIANINKIIEHIDNVPHSEFAYGEDERDLIKAEAFALRAMLHFDLLRLFAPAPSTNPSGTYLPYRDKFTSEIGDKLTVTAFIEKCLKDITVAEPILKKFDTEFHPQAMSTSNSSGSSSSWSAHYRFDSRMYIDEMGEFFWYRGWRINYMSLLAIKARICFYAGKAYYKNAQTAAGIVYNTFYKEKGWVGFTSVEDITATSDKRSFKMSDDVLFATYYKNLATEYDAVLYGNDNTVRYPLINVNDLFNSDITGGYSDLRYEYIIKGTNSLNKAYYTGKYSSSSDSYRETVENPMVPIIRLSEVCYMLAEIALENNDISGAIQYLTEVRNARGAYRTITAATTEKVLDEIILDMRKDLMTEGQLFFMYKRLNMEKVVNSSNTSLYRNMRDGYVIPIPTSESPF